MKKILILLTIAALIPLYIVAQKPFNPKVKKPLVTRVSVPYVPTNGLQNRHIALWQSHGWYYERKLDRWEWQRARIFQTVEDLYTQSYVLPYLVPMLESAGANVLLPRERDCQTEEVRMDNRGAREMKTVKKGEGSTVEWVPDLKKAGEYAVYVSYHTLKNSADDALYTVYHTGGKTEFRVNQQMGGGTWIYLGTFSLSPQMPCKVTLSNLSAKTGRVVTADSVKIGGGIGRSGYPRFCEAARYWLEDAGIPASVYSESNGTNDYTDDYKCRGLWVNYLAGGSEVNPKDKGLHIPLNLSFAFHTDAGTTMNDSIIGTLGIYYTHTEGEKYPTGASRYLSADLTDRVMTSIVDDIRTLYEPQWTRRDMWNKSYFEARVPRVPAMLLELLSHQNFADMRYGLDPRFRFTVSRAIYKGMLDFICAQYGTEPVVQPLPVEQMSLRMVGEDEVELTWQPVEDPLEPTAKAEQYIVYTRIGSGGFDNGTLVEGNRYRATIPADEVCSFKVTAVNRGGESFPSEILSAGRATASKGTVLVVNGFDRISAPADFAIDTLYAGFLDELDHGVPYLRDISYIGKMKEFRRSVPWMDDDASGFGDSYANYETQVIAGNTFDYPAVHGAAILKAGYSFVSCSHKSVNDINDYKIIDLILGKQCQTKMGRGGVVPLAFKTFSRPLQEALTAYCQQGGNLFVSGAFVGTDLWDNRLVAPDEADKRFATEVLKYKWRTGQAAIMGEVKSVPSPFPSFTGNYTYHNELNADSYVVESPDAIEPASADAHTVLRYTENNLSAAVAYRGDYKTCIMGFPFESLRTAAERESLMKAVLTFFEDTNTHKQ